MTVTDTDLGTDLGTEDPLKRVHHHCEGHDFLRALAGEAVTSLCGLIKRRSADVNSLPCCPMCSQILQSRGHRCQV